MCSVYKVILIAYTNCLGENMQISFLVCDKTIFNFQMNVSKSNLKQAFLSYTCLTDTTPFRWNYQIFSGNFLGIYTSHIICHPYIIWQEHKNSNGHLQILEWTTIMKHKMCLCFQEEHIRGSYSKVNSSHVHWSRVESTFGKIQVP